MSIAGSPKLSRFFELVDQGFRQPDYLARHIMPEIYETMPALAVLEIEETLAKLTAGTLQRPTITTQEGEDMAKKKPAPTDGKSAAAGEKEEKKPRKGQQYLDEEMAPPQYADLEEAAIKLARVRGERMKLGQQEEEALQVVIDLMHSRKLRKYVLHDGREVIVNPGKLKVSIVKPKEEK